MAGETNEGTRLRSDEAGGAFVPSKDAFSDSVQASRDMLATTLKLPLGMPHKSCRRKQGCRQ